MKTTVEIPDSLFHRAKVASAQRRTTLKQLVIDGLEKELAETPPPKPVELTPDQAEVLELDEFGVPVLKVRPVPPPDEFFRRIKEIAEDEPDQ